MTNNASEMEDCLVGSDVARRAGVVLPDRRLPIRQKRINLHSVSFVSQ